MIAAMVCAGTVHGVSVTTWFVKGNKHSDRAALEEEAARGDGEEENKEENKEVNQM